MFVSEIGATACPLRMIRCGRRSHQVESATLLDEGVVSSESVRGSSFELLYSRPNGPMAVTWVTYSPDFAQWKCQVSPGRTTTLPGGYASTLLPPFAQPDVEHAGHHGVDAVLRVLVRHQLDAGRHLDPDHIGTRLGRLTDDHGETNRRRKGRERLPVDVFRQDRLENGLAWLV